MRRSVHHNPMSKKEMVAILTNRGAIVTKFITIRSTSFFVITGEAKDSQSMMLEHLGTFTHSSVRWYYKVLLHNSMYHAVLQDISGYHQVLQGTRATHASVHMDF